MKGYSRHGDALCVITADTMEPNVPCSVLSAFPGPTL